MRCLNERLQLKGLPRTEAALQAISRGFTCSRNELSPLTGCVGALDGICVKVKKTEPRENPAMFYRRKGFYAIPVQALVDSSYIFRFCSATYTGATHDSLAYSVSALKREIDSGILGNLFYIVEDEAYTCTEELITPFPKTSADADQENFNFYHSSLRMHIEQAFGVLVARWRILRGGLEFSVAKSTDLICLLMKLHNFCLENDQEGSKAETNLTDHEKEVLKSDINHWYRESREAAKEFQACQEGRHPVPEGALLPRTNSVSQNRERFVQVVKAKGKERPNVILPMHHYRVDREPP